MMTSIGQPMREVIGKMTDYDEAQLLAFFL